MSSCLQGLADIQTIVVDNGSSQGAEQVLATSRPDAKLVTLEPQRSLAAAYNRGAKAGSAELVLFLNDDVVAEPGAIDRLLGTLRDDSGAVAAAGRLIDPDTGLPQREYEPRPFPGVGRFVAAFTGLARVWPDSPWTGPHRDRPLDLETVPVDQPAGACLLVRRRHLEAVGGWDEDFELWFEDIDFARRLSRRGRILYVPSARFRHVGGHSTSRLSRADVVRLSYGSALRYGEKHFGRARRVALGLMFGSAAAARSVLSRGDPELAAACRDVRRRAAKLIIGKRTT